MADKILFVDDDQIHNYIMENYVKFAKLPFESVFHLDGKEAIKYLADTDLKEWPKIVVVDLKMPFVDGLELLKKLQDEYPDIDERTCVVVLTASVSPNDKEKVAKFPFVKRYLIKPINNEELTDIINECLNTNFSRRPEDR